MSLSDPELDLLKELLADDPGADVWLQVGEELVRRSEWGDAEQVLSGGIAVHGATAEAGALLARAALEAGHIDTALEALASVPFDPTADPASSRLHVLVHERAGQNDALRSLVDRYLEADPGDVVVSAVLDRLENDTAPTGGNLQAGRTPDPMVSMDRALAYVAVGRPDRAARVYRRILFHHRGFAPAQSGLNDLGSGATGRMMTEDLSEELVDPSKAPSTLEMPEPRLQAMIADEEDTEPKSITDAIEKFARGEGTHPLPSTFDDDEITEPMSLLNQEEGGALPTQARRPRRRRRRRSLLNR